MSDRQDPLTASVPKLFFSYAIPSIVGLISISVAYLVDGMFIGKWVDSQALAAINLIAPFISLIYGFVLMLAVGGSIRAGKYLGESKEESAR